MHTGGFYKYCTYIDAQVNHVEFFFSTRLFFNASLGNHILLFLPGWEKGVTLLLFVLLILVDAISLPSSCLSLKLLH